MTRDRIARVRSDDSAMVIAHVKATDAPKVIAHVKVTDVRKATDALEVIAHAKATGAPKVIDRRVQREVVHHVRKGEVGRVQTHRAKNG